jgi:hypothetical protein
MQDSPKGSVVWPIRDLARNGNKWSASVPCHFYLAEKLLGVTSNRLCGLENQLDAMKWRKILLFLLGIGPRFLGRLSVTVATILTQPFWLYFSLNSSINEHFPF